MRVKTNTIYNVPLKKLSDSEFHSLTIQASLRGIKLNRLSSYTYEEIVLKSKKFLVINRGLDS